MAQNRENRPLTAGLSDRHATKTRVGTAIEVLSWLWAVFDAAKAFLIFDYLVYGRLW